MSELKPCPFCGGEARTASDATGFLQWVYCPECGGQSGYFTGNADGIKKLAIDAWNTRAQTVFGMTLDEVRQMMKRDAERGRTCYADEADHSRCKYSVNRGWVERTCKQRRLFNLVSRECDGEYYPWHGEEMPRYCPTCGAKVVSE